MRHPVPPIHEDSAALKKRRQHEHDAHQKPRLQMLSLLASGQAQTRQDIARLLGVQRHPLNRWLAGYAVGGLSALLATSVPADQSVALAPEILTSLAQALRRPAGCAA